MTQYQQPPYQQSPYGPTDVVQQRKTSGLAITALICSLIFCCPITTLLGILLGLIAMVTIGRNPYKKGRGLALAAILLGLIFTVLQGIAFYWGKVNFSDIERGGPGSSIIAASNGNYSEFREMMYGGANTASDEEIKAFVTELETRYGKLQSTAFDPSKFKPTTEDMFNPVQARPYVFNFENATMYGEATLSATDPQTQQFLGGYRFGSITIHDPDLGDITFPPGAASSSSSSITITPSKAIDDVDDENAVDDEMTTDDSSDDTDSGGE